MAAVLRQFYDVNIALKTMTIKLHATFFVVIMFHRIYYNCLILYVFNITTNWMLLINLALPPRFEPGQLGSEVTYLCARPVLPVPPIIFT